MPVDYFDFRTKDWSYRIRLFNTISAEERADLVRTHVSWWLEAHREELSPEQIGVLEEVIAAIVPELYAIPRNDRDEKAPFESLLNRAKSLFTPDQMRQAMTMHWKPGDFGSP